MISYLDYENSFIFLSVRFTLLVDFTSTPLSCLMRVSSEYVLFTPLMSIGLLQSVK